MNLIKRFVIGTCLALSCVAVAAAANVHLKGSDGPMFDDMGMVLSADGQVAGVGNGDLLVTMDAGARGVMTCTNPSGENMPPGSQPSLVFVSGSELIPDEQTKNGWTSFYVETMEPVLVIPGAPDCPNEQWTQELVDLQFTHAVLTFEQPVGNVVLEVSCMFDPPTEDGLTLADCTTL